MPGTVLSHLKFRRTFFSFSSPPSFMRILTPNVMYSRKSCTFGQLVCPRIQLPD